ncbi:MAG TPA: YgcG family protein [Allosphingosinicella sp.]|jgi:uncharacterized protein
MMWRWVLLLLLAVATPAAAQDLPKLTGRVVDTADLLNPQDEAALTQKLEAVQQATTRQFVVVTVPDLQGYPIDDYGVRLGRAWGIGQKGANNGIILLISKSERKVRIEVGYGLEPIVTDAFSGRVIRNDIIPHFKQNDYPGGINAGVDAIVQQLQAPPEEQERQIQQATAEQKQSHHRAGSFIPLIFWGGIMLFMFAATRRGGRYGRRYGGFPVMIWGPGLGGWGGGGGGFSGGGGFGGFSGGGGSFGGGGASGGW